MHHPQGLHDPPVDFALGTGLHPEPEGHVVAHAHVREQRVVLEDGIDLTAFGRNVVHPLAADEHFPGIRGLEARKDSENGRLAATGRSKEGQKLAVADAQVDAAKRASVLERFVHAPQFDDIVLSGHAFRLPPFSLRRPTASENDAVKRPSEYPDRSAPVADCCEKAPVRRIPAACPGTSEDSLQTFSFTQPLHEASQRVKKIPTDVFYSNHMFQHILSSCDPTFFAERAKKRLSSVPVRAKKGFFTGCGSVW